MVDDGSGFWVLMVNPHIHLSIPQNYKARINEIKLENMVRPLSTLALIQYMSLAGDSGGRKFVFIRFY